MPEYRQLAEETERRIVPLRGLATAERAARRREAGGYEPRDGRSDEERRAEADERGWSTPTLVDAPQPDDEYDPFKEMGLQQWFHVHDPELPVTVWFRIGVDEGRLVCTGLILGGNVPDEVVQDRHLRRISITSLLNDLADMAAGDHGPIAEWWAREIAIGEGAPYGEPRVRPGPQGWSDDHFQMVADLYRECLRDRPRSATAELHRRLRDDHRHFVSRATVDYWLRTARRRGFLGEALPGKAGERPAPKRKDQR